MKKLTTILGAFLLCVCFLFAGCSPTLTMPTGDIKSNGGSSVVIGEYVYFANTYLSTSSLKTGDNDESNVKHNSIYRVKTQNGLTTKDDNGNVENVEKVFSKIGGFETSNMYIVGNFLYFTSPNTHKSSVEGEEGKDKFGLTTLFRCKLDGTGLKEILTTQTTAGKFYLTNQDGKNILFVFDNSKIQSIELANKLGKLTTVVDKVSDVVFPEENGKTLTRLFYTVSLTEEDGTNEGVTGNKLYRYDFATKNSTLVRQIAGETISLVAFDTNRLYYTRNENGTTLYYSNSLAGNFEVDEVQHTYVANISQFYAFGTSEDGDVLPVVYSYNSKLFLQTSDGNPVVIENTSATIEFISNEYVYYTTDSGIYRKSYKTPTADPVQITDKTNIKAGTVDFDGRFVYFYAYAENNSTDTYYMHRANTKTAELGRINTEVIGEVLPDDITEIE